jgi:hypothetical protein
MCKPLLVPTPSTTLRCPPSPPVVAVHNHACVVRARGGTLATRSALHWTVLRVLPWESGPFGLYFGCFLGNLCRYANRVRNIRNKPVVNRDVTAGQISSLKLEIQNLRQALEAASRDRGSVSGSTPPTPTPLTIRTHLIALEVTHMIALEVTLPPPPSGVRWPSHALTSAHTPPSPLLSFPSPPCTCQVVLGWGPEQPKRHGSRRRTSPRPPPPLSRPCSWCWDWTRVPVTASCWTGSRG